MNSAKERIIIQALAALEEGRSIEEILSVHPEQAEMLKPILSTASELSSLKVAHTVGAQTESLDQFLAAANSKNMAAARGRSVLVIGRRLALSFSALLLLLALILVPLTLAAQSSLPGEALYGPKLAIEEFRLSLVREAAGRVKLAADFNQNRIEEIEDLIATDLSASFIEFTGIINTIAGDSWNIAGVPITVSESLSQNGHFSIGQLVIVGVEVNNGEVQAVRLLRLSQPESAPETRPENINESDESALPDGEETPNTTSTPSAADSPTSTVTPELLELPTPAPAIEDDLDENNEINDSPKDDDTADDDNLEDNSGSGGDESDDDSSEGSDDSGDREETGDEEDELEEEDDEEEEEDHSEEPEDDPEEEEDEEDDEEKEGG